MNYMLSLVSFASKYKFWNVVKTSDEEAHPNFSSHTHTHTHIHTPVKA